MWSDSSRPSAAVRCATCCWRLPPFWMQNVSYLVVSGFAFLFVVGLRKYVIRLNNTFFIFDAVGLGLFTVVGIQKSIAVGYPMWVAYHHGYADRCGGRYAARRAA